MLRLICKRLSLVKASASPFSHGFSLSNSFIRPMSELSSSIDRQSFTVSYLQNSCGFSQNSAIAASKKLLFENSEQPDSVLELLRTQGLTQSQIEKIIFTRPQLLEANLEDTLRPKMEFLESLGFSGASMVNLVTKDPRVLDCDLVDSVQLFRAHGFSDEQIKALTMKRASLHFYNVKKTVKPKLEFFKFMGFTDEDIARIVSSEPYILERSLENQIIPCIEVLKRVLGTDENVRKVIKACYWILEYNLEKMLVPNISLLKSHGVPENLIVKLFLTHPRTLLLRSQKFTEILAEVVQLGFNPNTLLFVLAIRSMAVMSKALWEQKVETYKSFGLTKDQVYLAFKLQPMCMLTSEKKIKKVMHFLINKLNMEASMICRNPNLLMLSLEKRLIPRSSVLQLLIASGFLKEDINIIYYLRMTEQKFVEKLVRKYKQVLPNIVLAHEGKIEFLGFPVILKS
ncbi:transcription termination factor MTERF15, mitochondrial-like [Humulus lupulus]|uniref:transcription termination factor MTERF15, mitochondrial-like n=1 Tax=Humulus lupulus TaxID=3486 RepID=UPI002B41325E|nr:transcription termination factor MTERF15, mitochondrial-like [Humulus lupulus]